MYTLLTAGMEARLLPKIPGFFAGLLGLYMVREAGFSDRCALDFSKATREAKEVNMLRLSSRSRSFYFDIFLGGALWFRTTKRPCVCLAFFSNIC